MPTPLPSVAMTCEAPSEGGNSVDLLREIKGIFFETHFGEISIVRNKAKRCDTKRSNRTRNGLPHGFIGVSVDLVG